MLSPRTPKIRAAAWLLVVAGTLTSIGHAAPDLVAAPQRQSTTAYRVASHLAELGPGYYALRGRIYPRTVGVTMSLDRRTCPTCSWTEVAKTATVARGHYDFRIDAPSADTVSYRVRVADTIAGSPAYSGAFEVSALPEATDATLPYWGEPTWRDEFNGTEVDSRKWRVLDKDRVSYDIASLYKSQAKVRDGKLILTANRVDPSKDMYGRSWASAYLDTRGGRFSQRYGRFEMMARLPTKRWESRGLWPSFWLRDDNGPGEIDVMEAWGTPSAKPGEEDPGNSTWSVHSDTMGGGTRVSSWARKPADPSVARGWYRYAVEWTPDGIRIFVNDTQVGYLPQAKYPWIATAFPTTANMRLQFAVGSSYWGLPDTKTASPAQYEIEYVRVWKYPGA